MTKEQIAEIEAEAKCLPENQATRITVLALLAHISTLSRREAVLVAECEAWRAVKYAKDGPDRQRLLMRADAMSGQTDAAGLVKGGGE